MHYLAVALKQAAKRIAQGQALRLDWGAYDQAVNTHLKQAQKKILRSASSREATGLPHDFREGVTIRPYICRTLSHPNGKGRQLERPCSNKCPNFPCVARGIKLFPSDPEREWDTWAIEHARAKFEERVNGAGASRA